MIVSIPFGIELGGLSKEKKIATFDFFFFVLSLRDTEIVVMILLIYYTIHSLTIRQKNTGQKK